MPSASSVAKNNYYMHFFILRGAVFLRHGGLDSVSCLLTPVFRRLSIGEIPLTPGGSHVREVCPLSLAGTARQGVFLSFRKVYDALKH